MFDITAFGETKKLADVTPRDVDRFVAWMIDGAGEFQIGQP